MLIIFLLLITTNSLNIKNEKVEDKKIITLNDNNYKNYLKENNYILILFTASFCKKTSKILKNLENLKKNEFFITKEIKIIKTDILINKEIKNYFHITKIPELKFIKKGVYFDFKENLNKNEKIEKFVKKKIGEKIIGIKNESELRWYQEPMVVYFFFPENESEENIFLLEKIKTKFENFVFVYFSNEDLKKKFFIKQNYAIVFVRDFEYNDILLEKNEKLNFKEIFNFLKIHKEKDILFFDENINNKIWQERNTTLFFFLKKENTQEYYDNLEIFQKLSKKYKGEMYFSISEVKEGYGINLAHHLGVNLEKAAPIYCFLKFEKKGIKKYIFFENNFAELEKKYKDFKENKLPRFYRSQKSLKNDNSLIKKIVGEDFEEKVLKNKKSVFLMVLHEGNKNTDILNKVFTKLAPVFENRIIFAKFDAGSNEHKSLRIKRFPIFIYYKNGYSSITYKQTYNEVKFFLEDMLDNFNHDEDL